MPESVVQVAPDSTGKKLHTRQRTVGANTVEEQYVIALQSEAVPINRVWVSTLRIPSRVVAASTATTIVSQPLFYVYNGITAGGNSVSIRRFTVEVDTLAAQATGGSPTLKLHRITAALPGTPGGTTLTPEKQYTSDPTFSTSVIVRADHGLDLASAATALAAPTISAQPMWSQLIPRAASLVGFQAIGEYNMMPNDASLMSVDPLILRPAEGAYVRMDTSLTTGTAAGQFTFTFKCVLAEFTYP